jgi:hypothetical protein
VVFFARFVGLIGVQLRMILRRGKPGFLRIGCRPRAESPGMIRVANRHAGIPTKTVKIDKTSLAEGRDFSTCPKCPNCALSENYRLNRLCSPGPLMHVSWAAVEGETSVQ